MSGFARRGLPRSRLTHLLPAPLSPNSKTIRPRNPLSRDRVLLDYDFDSEEEWEEEPEGEDLGGDDMVR